MGFARSVSAGATFEPHATALNVIPSRQNLFLPEHRRRGPRAHWLPWEGVYSVGSHDSAELLVSPRDDRWTRQLREAADGPYRPLLLEEDVKKAGTPATPRTEHELSLSEAVFNLANTVLGVGVLSIPYAFRLSGYVSILLILVTILVTAQTGVFIGSALQLASRSPQAASVPPRGRDFTFLAYVGFGGRGAALIAFVTSVEVWFALVTFMVMNGVNVSVVFPEVGAGVASVTSCVLAVVMVFIPMRVYSYLSVVASLALAVAAVALVAAAFTMREWANPYDHLGLDALLQLQNIPRSVGIIVFCFAGHPCFPVVYECMKEPRRWQSSISLTFFLAFVYYGGLGVFGYLVFGEGLEASVTKNLASLPQARFFRHMSALAFVVKIQLTAPVLMNAILVSLWPPSEMGPEWTRGRIVALFALTAATALTALLFSSEIAVVAALTGSLFTMATSVMFPAAVHLRLAAKFGEVKSLFSRAYLPHLAVLVFGVVMAATGTYLSVMDMVRKLVKS